MPTKIFSRATGADAILEDISHNEFLPDDNLATPTGLDLVNRNRAYSTWIRPTTADIQAQIPAGSTITAVRLRYFVQFADGVNGTVTGYRGLRNWVLLQATWNSYSTGNAWATAGGEGSGTDIGASASWTYAVTGGSSGSQTYSLGAGGIADVQGWLDGTITNGGWKIEYQNVTPNDDGIFVTGGSGATAANRIAVEVDYTDPAASIPAVNDVLLGGGPLADGPLGLRLRGAATSGAGVESRTLSAAGVATVAFQSQAIAAQALNSAGVAAASFAAQAINARIFTSPGVAALTWQASSVLPASFSSAGVASTAWQSASIVPASFASPGAAVVSWQSLAINAQTLSSSGAAAVSFAAQSIDAKAFASAGVASVSWVGVDASGGATIEPRTFSAAGVGAASFTAQAIAARTFTAPGVAAATWAGQSIAGVQWSSAGVGAFTPQSSAILPRTLSAAGVASVSWVGVDGATPTIEARTFEAAGVASVVWVPPDTAAPAGGPRRRQQWQLSPDAMAPMVDVSQVEEDDLICLLAVL